MNKKRTKNKSGGGKELRALLGDLVDPDGQPVEVQGVARGIIERKRTERLRRHSKHLEELVRERTRNLQKSEEKYRDLIEKEKDIIYALDDKGNITFASPAVETILGYRPEGLIGKNFVVLIAKESKEKTGVDFNNLLKTGEITAETILLDKKGRPHFVEYSSTTIKEGNKVVGARGIVRDITERKRAEEELKEYRKHLEKLVEKRTAELIKTNEQLQRGIEERKRAEKALRENEEKFRLAFESAKDAILWADPKTGLITNCNKAAEILLEKKRGEIVGCHQTTIHPPQKAEYYANMFKKHIEQKRTVDDEAEVITKSGKIKSVHITASVTLVGGKPIIQGIFRDITERKKAENRIKTEREVYRSIARAANRSRSVEELCELALKGIRRAIRYDMANVSIYRESENALFSVAQVGYPEDLHQRTIKRQDLKKEGSGVAARAALKRKSIYIDDMKTNELTSYAHNLARKYNVSTMYTVPLLSRGKLQGVLQVLTTGSRKLSKENHEVLDTVSEELAGGIAKAKIEEGLVTVKEAFGWIPV